jgi:hypothetical protein
MDFDVSPAQFKVSIVPQNPIQWSGVCLTRAGTYTIEGTTIGTSAVALGDTSGNKSAANCRVTTGKTVMADDRESYSSAGRHCVARTYSSGASWPANRPFRVVVTEDDMALEIRPGEELFKLSRLEMVDSSGPRLPVMIGFMNLKLTVSYQPLFVPERKMDSKEEAKAKAKATSKDAAEAALVHDLASAHLSTTALLDGLKHYAVAVRGVKKPAAKSPAK